MSDLKITLHGLQHFNSTVRQEIVWIVKREFDPMVKAAGKHLRIMLGPSRGDLNINFDSKTPAGGPCKFTFLGEDGGEVVFVKAHRNLRVCSAPDPHTGKRDLRRILTNDWLVARALANTAIHELGHFIADLKDTTNTGTFMSTGDLPVAQRTRASQRQHWAGKQVFKDDEKRKIIHQLKTGEWLGDFQVNGK